MIDYEKLKLCHELAKEIASNISLDNITTKIKCNFYDIGHDFEVEQNGVSIGFINIDSMLNFLQQLTQTKEKYEGKEEDCPNKYCGPNAVYKLCDLCRKIHFMQEPCTKSPEISTHSEDMHKGSTEERNHESKRTIDNKDFVEQAYQDIKKLDFPRVKNLNRCPCCHQNKCDCSLKQSMYISCQHEPIDKIHIGYNSGGQRVFKCNCGAYFIEEQCQHESIMTSDPDYVYKCKHCGEYYK